MKTLLTTLLITVCGLVFAQNVINLTNSICAYDIRYPLKGKYIDLTLSEDGDETGLTFIIEKMKNLAGMQNQFYTYYGRNINNAYATREFGEDWIIIDIDFLEYINRYAGTEWAGISIIAHEIGHHYFNHLKGNNKGSESELEADYFSGWMLAKLGASRSSSVKAILSIGTEHNSHSHPNKYKRARYIRAGWNQAKK